MIKREIYHIAYMYKCIENWREIPGGYIEYNFIKKADARSTGDGEKPPRNYKIAKFPPGDPDAQPCTRPK